VKVIVDTNVIFSALLNSNNSIGDLLFNSGKVFEFYSCNYMRFEINKHWVKLKRISKLSEEWFQNNFPQKRATCLEKRTGSEVQCKTKVLGNS
jgi:predicted nucleic acid-binding protein